MPLKGWLLQRVRFFVDRAADRGLLTTVQGAMLSRPLPEGQKMQRLDVPASASIELFPLGAEVVVGSAPWLSSPVPLLARLCGLLAAGAHVAAGSFPKGSWALRWVVRACGPCLPDVP